MAPAFADGGFGRVQPHLRMQIDANAAARGGRGQRRGGARECDQLVLRRA